MEQLHLTASIVLDYENPRIFPSCVVCSPCFVVSLVRCWGGEAAFGVDFMTGGIWSVLLSIWEGIRACHSCGLSTWDLFDKCPCYTKKSSDAVYKLHALSPQGSNLRQIIRQNAWPTGFIGISYQIFVQNLSFFKLYFFLCPNIGTSLVFLLTGLIPVAENLPTPYNGISNWNRVSCHVSLLLKSQIGIKTLQT